MPQQGLRFVARWRLHGRRSRGPGRAARVPSPKRRRRNVCCWEEPVRGGPSCSALPRSNGRREARLKTSESASSTARFTASAFEMSGKAAPDRTAPPRPGRRGRSAHVALSAVIGAASSARARHAINTAATDTLRRFIVCLLLPAWPGDAIARVCSWRASWLGWHETRFGFARGRSRHAALRFHHRAVVRRRTRAGPRRGAWQTKGKPESRVQDI